MALTQILGRRQNVTDSRIWMIYGADFTHDDDAIIFVTSSSDDDRALFQKNWPLCQTS